MFNNWQEKKKEKDKFEIEQEPWLRQKSSCSLTPENQQQNKNLNEEMKNQS
jgi:hypothetical protein